MPDISTALQKKPNPLGVEPTKEKATIKMDHCSTKYCLYEEQKIEFDEDSSSEMEIDEDSSSEMELDEDSSSEFRPFDDAAKKADEILNNTLARMKKQDKGPTIESETAYLVTLKSNLVELFRLEYGIVFTKCKCDDLGRHVYEGNTLTDSCRTTSLVGCFLKQTSMSME